MEREGGSTSGTPYFQVHDFPWNVFNKEIMSMIFDNIALYKVDIVYTKIIVIDT